MLANVYLHYALDLWARRWRRREAMGDMIIVRYADDFIVGFQHESDAQRFLDEMRKRLGEFALSLHPEKTRLIEFGRFAAERRKQRGPVYIVVADLAERWEIAENRQSRSFRMRLATALSAG